MRAKTPIRQETHAMQENSTQCAKTPPAVFSFSAAELGARLSISAINSWRRVAGVVLDKKGYIPHA